MKLFNFTLLFLFSITGLPAQELAWLKNSTSEDVFTSHQFHTSTYHDGHFYLSGEFWKDITIDEFHLEIADEFQDGMIIKMDENGVASDLWHFESDNYLRIVQMEINPITSDLIIVGFFRTNLVYNNLDWNTPYFGDGFVMSINLDGSFNWLKELDSESEWSSAAGQALAIDNLGNIFVNFSASGEVSIEGQSFVYPEKTIGALMVKFDSEGNILMTQPWYVQGFEVDFGAQDMAIDAENNLVVAGGFLGTLQIDNFEVSAPAPGLQPIVLKFTNDLSPIWINTYISNNSLVNDIYIDGTNILLSLQYNTSISLDGINLTGTGSWGELAFVNLDKDGAVEWVKNITMTQNEGNSGFYANTICQWMDQYYIGGMYQGPVLFEGEIILANTNNAGDNSYQYPYLLSFSKEGDLTSAYSFSGSTEPGRISTLSASDSHLVFAGDFSGQVNLLGSSVNTINSALFYGALKTEINPTAIAEIPKQSFSIYPNLTSSMVSIKSEQPLNNLYLVNQQGKVLKEILMVNQYQTTIDVSNLVAGIYYLRAYDGNQAITECFVKQ